MSKQLNAETAIESQDTPFAPNFGGKRLLSIMIAASLPGLANANVAGTVDFSAGSATVVHADGNRERLTNGMKVSESDTIKTGSNGLAQVRFTDGAFVSIQKNTVFIIDEYAYDGQANTQGGKGKSKNKGFFSLLSGSFRAITGFLGADNYQVKTPVATIGIRGTEYFAEFGRSLTFNVADGAIEVCNTAGCQFFRENEFGDVADNASLIQRLQDLGLDVVVSEVKDKTVATIEGDDDFIFRITEEVTDDGDLQILQDAATPDCTGGNCAAAFGWVDGMDTYGVYSASSVAAEFSDGALVSHNGGNGATADAVGSGFAQSVASTPSIAWGRWTGGISEAGKIDIHYVIGIPTPDINSLTGNASFSVAGWTNPTTNISGLGAFNGIQGNLNANFDSALVDMNFTADYANADYHVSTYMPMPINNDATFGGTITAFGGLPEPSGTSCDTFGCTASVSGFFVGANASAAGLSYHVKDNGKGDLTGVAVFGSSTSGTILDPDDR